MSYQHTIAYLDSLINYEKIARYPYKGSFKLERIRDFLARIGNPHHALRCIHVAGTKGKGSVCVLTAYMLREMGFRVGLYTSPHLSDVRERIRVLEPGVKIAAQDFEGMIPKSALTRITQRLRPRISEYGRRSVYGALSFFEVYTALAFVYFKGQRIDYAVLETGLGGRLDATNVVQPDIVGLTSISYDHMNKLGSTLKEIAAEKAGIIKDGTRSSLVISAPQSKEVREVVRERCAALGARLYEVGTDIRCEKVSTSPRGQVFNCAGVFGSFDSMRLPFLGEHQLVNAAVALGLVSGCFAHPLDRKARSNMRIGMRNASWPGRCEIIAGRPRIILDGAHNEASAEALARTLRSNAAKGNIILVIGVSKDKDARGICRHLVPLARHCIATQADNPRARSAAAMAAVLMDYQSPVIQAQRVAEALAIARRCSRGSDTIVVTGSLFIVGEARQLLFKKGGMFS
jgi:dihydrofolate synthase / folylpolyglutamate synthase